MSGRRLFETLLESFPKRFEEIYLLSSLSDYNDKLEKQRLAGRVRRVDRIELDELSRNSSHQGVVFSVSRAPELTLEEFLKPLGEEGRPGLILVLDEVVDPQNLGALLRVAEVSGCAGVIITERRSAPLSPAARRASAGASELLPLVRVTNLRRALDLLKEKGFWTVGTSLQPGSKDFYDFAFPDKTALVLGSEGSGLRALTASQCDFLITIPMWGRVESLNVSQAGSVCLFEYRRQMLKPDVKTRS